MAKTIDDLNSLRDELEARLRSEAYAINGAYDEKNLAKVVQVHLAIAAIKQVIAEGFDQPEPDIPDISYWPGCLAGS